MRYAYKEKEFSDFFIKVKTQLMKRTFSDPRPVQAEAGFSCYVA